MLSQVVTGKMDGGGSGGGDGMGKVSIYIKG